MRILVTGSRDWDDAEAIMQALCELHEVYTEEKHILVSGACPTGADMRAEGIAEMLGWGIERHPADWDGLGKAAGPIRNQKMVDLGADICLAFIKDESRGATMTARMAEKAGISTKRWEI